MALLNNRKPLSTHDSFDPFEIFDDVAQEVTAVSRDHISCNTSKKEVGDLSSGSNIAPTTKSPTNKSINPQTVYGHRNWFKQGLRLLINRPLSILCLFIVTCYLAYVGKPWSYFIKADLVYAYFEIRAVDLDGRPIAGAIVKNSGQKVGTTDSFGEWRRYMRVPLGGTVPITLIKKIKNETLFLTKNFAIPPLKPEKSEIELRFSVQLLPTNQRIDTSEGELNVNRKEASISASTTDFGLSFSKLQESFKSRMEGANSKKSAMNTSYDNDKDVESKLLSANPDSIWFEVVGRKESPLRHEVLPALVSRAKELGLRVEQNAKWVVQLKSLLDKPGKISKDGGGLILVRSVAENSPKDLATEFLRNYQSDAMSTARGILFSLINHIKKDVMLIKSDDRWAAVISKESPIFWKMSSETLISSGARAFSLSKDPYSTKSYTGFYLDKHHRDPCADSKPSCVGRTLTFGEVPPVSDWVKLKLKGSSYQGSDSSVFVAGYRARKVGANLYEYWGQDRVQANVTVIKDGRLIIRGVVQNKEGEVAVVGGRNLTRR